MVKSFTLLIITIISFYLSSNAQDNKDPKTIKKDKGSYKEVKNEFWDEIEKTTNDFKKKEDKKDKTYKMDFGGKDLPKQAADFMQIWHNQPVSQGFTNTCWCFCSTSWLETEIKRLHNKEIKISEMYTVYWEYVEKARRFVREHGNSYVAEGGLTGSTLRIWKKYGCVPAESFTGLKKGQKFLDHRALIDEITSYLDNVKKSNNWNEEIVLSTIKQILNYHIGEPPSEVLYNGKKMTPMDFFKNEIKLELDDYVDFISDIRYPYWEKTLHDVADNWSRSEDYYNIPLNDFMKIIKEAVKNGFSVPIGGDVSSSGYESHVQVAIVPTYDIPSEYIDEYARQLRIAENTTTDDHGIHIVGWIERKDGTWFLIKDSGAGSRNGTNKGYYFYHEDYIKLKMLNVTVHKSAIPELIKKLKV